MFLDVLGKIGFRVRKQRDFVTNNEISFVVIGDRMARVDDGRKRKREEWKASGKGQFFIGLLKESLPNTIRQLKWTTVDIPIEKEDVCEWSEVFATQSQEDFDPNFRFQDGRPQRIILWKVQFQSWKENEVFMKEDGRRVMGQQATVVLIEKDKPFEVSLIGKRIYDYMSEDNFGKVPIQNSLKWYDLFHLHLKFKTFYAALDVANKLQ